MTESLSNYTSWGVGGPAKRLFKPKNIDELATFLVSVPDGEPVEFLGLGSNTLVRDEGFDGTVIVCQGGMNELGFVDGLLRAEAGVASPKIARFCAKNGFVGLEFLATVPGTLGGALAMNAGAYDGETWDFVKAVDVVNRRGEIIRRNASEFEVGYRSVVGRADEWFVAGYFELGPGESVESLEKIKGFLAHRAKTQPTSENSCGSVFRNPPGDYAGRLIEACGLKGFKVGGAQVSPKHANFIVNAGGASAGDIEAVIEHVEQCVEKTHGVTLIREVRILK